MEKEGFEADMERARRERRTLDDMPDSGIGTLA
jgi:hypothetical protein